jgi:hypothetical protein
LKKYSIKRYETKDYNNWNAFLGKAKNATFLFHRDFMDYHSDRFEDYSLMVFENEKLISVLPANRVGNVVFSHQGLTYGGLVYDEKTKLTTVIAVFRSILSFLNENKIDIIHIKTIPSIYHVKPAEELNYPLFLAEAKLERRDSLAVVDLSQKHEMSSIRKRGVKKGINNGLQIKEDDDGFESFWNEILVPNLIEKYNTNPVHTLEEIRKLKMKFPTNIRQFNVYFEDKIVAGTTIFESKMVAHAQYISANESKDEFGSLDFLYDYLLTKKFNDKAYFDFGISNEAQGRKLNGGLSYWKESFGASTIVHDFYEVETANFSKLDDVII